MVGLVPSKGLATRCIGPCLSDRLHPRPANGVSVRSVPPPCLFLFFLNIQLTLFCHCSCFTVLFGGKHYCKAIYSFLRLSDVCQRPEQPGQEEQGLGENEGKLSPMWYFYETHMSKPEHEKLRKFGYSDTYCSSCNNRKRGVIMISNSLNFEMMKVDVY